MKSRTSICLAIIAHLFLVNLSHAQVYLTGRFSDDKLEAIDLDSGKRIDRVTLGDHGVYPITSTSLIAVLASGKAGLDCDGYEPDFNVTLKASGVDFSRLGEPQKTYLTIKLSDTAGYTTLLSFHVPQHDIFGFVDIHSHVYAQTSVCPFSLQDEEGLESYLDIRAYVMGETYAGCCQIKQTNRVKPKP